MKPKSTTFYCFSPPVMLATFLIETTLLVYVGLRYRLSALSRLAMLTLGCLATFQLAEYYVCGGIGVDAATWSRVGYVAITMLPPLGLHITNVVAKRKLNAVTVGAYALGFAWAGLFAFGGVFNSHVCGGNYVIFQLKSPLGGLYFAYYYLLLFISMWQALHYSQSAKRGIRKALLFQVLGYMLFIVPTTVVNIFWPNTFSGIPSIMCGFAVMYAIVLARGVVPAERLVASGGRVARRA